jgi:hypothetical protein
VKSGLRANEIAGVTWRMTNHSHGEEIVACEQASITVYLLKPMTSDLLAKGRFGKQDFIYVVADDVYLCPAGEQANLSLHP